MPNGNVLLICWEVKAREEVVAAGQPENRLPPSGEIWSESLFEYAPKPGRW